MGRGRQKAKQKKVARALKYYSPDPDYKSLEKELNNNHDDEHVQRAPEEEYDDYEDYGRWASGQK